MEKKRIAVLGAGSWGTSLACVLVENGHEVTIWARRKELAEEINQIQTNHRYLPGIQLPPALIAVSDLSEAIANRDMIVFVLPSQTIRQVAGELRTALHSDTLIVHACKGFEQTSYKRISEVLAEELPDAQQNQIAVLSGPSHAEEVIRKSPTTVVIASSQQETAEAVQSIFMNRFFRVYTNPDLVGIEVGGALKNIIAIAAGLSVGLGFGDNAKAALMTRGLAEIARLGKAMGAKPITFVGLAGVGDLIATCTSEHSRNFRAGFMLSQGMKLEEVLQEIGMVVEGVTATKTAFVLAKKYRVEMPITEQLFQVLFHGKTPGIAVTDLMARGKTGELKEIFDQW